MLLIHVGGLLAIKNGSIKFERYGLGNTEDSLWVSYSMSKSATSMLLGAAIQDGYIASVDDKVTDYLSRLKGSSYAEASLKDVLQMASGVEWDEDYADPNSDVATYPSGEVIELLRFLGNKERVAEPGEVFNYNTGETDNGGVLTDGTSVVPQGWMQEATTSSTGNAGYGYLWWLLEGPVSCY